MSNAYAYDIADMSGDPLYILMCREDDEDAAEELESRYMAGRSVRSHSEPERYVAHDVLGAAPYELMTFADGE